MFVKALELLLSDEGFKIALPTATAAINSN